MHTRRPSSTPREPGRITGGSSTGPSLPARSEKQLLLDEAPPAPAATLQRAKRNTAGHVFFLMIINIPHPSPPAKYVLGHARVVLRNRPTNATGTRASPSDTRRCARTRRRARCRPVPLIPALYTNIPQPAACRGPGATSWFEVTIRWEAGLGPP